MPIVQTEGAYVSDWLKRENTEYLFSRETVELAPATYITGTVLGKITATGVHKILTPAAADGSQDVAGILVLDTVAVAGTKAAIIKRGDHVVVGEALTWPAGITAPQKAAALAQLETMGIVSRVAV